MFSPFRKSVRRAAAALPLLLCLAALPLAGQAAGPPANADGVRLYALDCGRLDFKDMWLFSDTEELDGKPGSLAAPCFLVHHPKGWLLWDTGLGDGLAKFPQGRDMFGGLVHETVSVTLAGQLKVLGLAPKDIRYVAFSHLHGDHAGNANLFARTSTWIVDQRELAYATASPPPLGVDANEFSGYRSARLQLIDGDLDVFGDGIVRILRAPGHTPGHRVLQLKLRNAGTVILSGDLYHLRANHDRKRVPPVNASRADTLASFDRIEGILATTHGRLVIQHDPGDFAALPKFPAWLD